MSEEDKKFEVGRATDGMGGESKEEGGNTLAEQGMVKPQSLLNIMTIHKGADMLVVEHILPMIKPRDFMRFDGSKWLVWDGDLWTSNWEAARKRLSEEMRGLLKGQCQGDEKGYGEAVGKLATSTYVEKIMKCLQGSCSLEKGDVQVGLHRMMFSFHSELPFFWLGLVCH